MYVCMYGYAHTHTHTHITGAAGAGGGTNIGTPPGRGGHTAMYLPANHLGVGGLFVVGGILTHIDT